MQGTLLLLQLFIFINVASKAQETYSCKNQQHCNIEIALLTLPYVADCTKYIYCLSDGSNSLQSCPESKHFSPIAFTCMDPKSAQCPYCPEQINTNTTIAYCGNQPHCTPELTFTTLPYLADCKRYIYCEEGGGESIRKCPNDYFYSPIENRCTDPEISNCTECIVTTTEFSCPNQPHCTPELAFTTLPYVADCTQYIYCGENGTESLRKCPNDFHYSATENRCMDQQLANCIDCVEITTHFSCPGQPHCTPELAFTTLPYIADCTHYIYCDENGTESLRKCPNGYHYSSIENRCMDQQLANCIDCIEITTPFSCPVQPHCTMELAFSTLPYIADCTKYIYCGENGTESIRKCPSDFHYSATENRCIEKELTNCIDCVEITTQFSCPDQFHCTPELAFSTLPYIADCTQYIYCGENGTESLRKCPNDFHFSSTENRCMEQQLANCVECIEITTVFSCPIQPHCTPELAFATLPYIADCTQYIYCDENGTESLRKCPNAFHYSSTENRCIEKELANCVDCIEITTEFSCPNQPHCTPELAFTTLPYIADCTQYIYCDENGTESLRKCPNDFHYSATENRCMDQQLANCIDCVEITTQFSCLDQPHCTPELAFSTLPYISDCTQYIYCGENGTESLRKCPEFQHYSPSESRCTDPDLANCPECMESTTELYCPEQPHCTPELVYTTLPLITDCTQYIYCEQGGFETLRKCPDQQHYSSSEKRCMDLAIAQCPACMDLTTQPFCPEQPVCTAELVYTTLPIIADCSRYIYCSDGTESLRKCPDDQHYSPIQMRCTHPLLAECPQCGDTSTTITTPLI